MVYAVRFGPYIKIGYAFNAWQRIREIPCEQVLVVSPGNVEVEQAIHDRLGAHRASLLGGQQEWYRATPEVHLEVEYLRMLNTLVG